ncbi:beta-carotene 15,15'-monooxygenase [Chryseobacterium sp. Leaf180]|uniref:DUF4153 domain-containing protein n=1 Tax=Chryseobacterium sp. Leaf180 TaxID=1736289 RepID=UPI0006F9575E|nr:DUF4153 domain-containing protein [Chryseobacterium sp. Leaf180]KQR93739.1 beta-carotene 15,15'-monooxygenase [Chryseobacterium sp. Leaf180]
MKTHHYIFLTTAVFIILFYDQNLGLNLGILAVIFSLLTFIKTHSESRTKSFYFFLATSVFSAIAFAWYGDFSSFAAVALSLMAFGFRAREKRLNILMLLPVALINAFTFICRAFNFERWLPKTKTSHALQKILAFVAIPLCFVVIFFWVYASGSSHFLNVFTGYKLNLNLWQLIVISVLGFFISFNYWNFSVEKQIYKQHSFFKIDLDNSSKNQKPTFSFLDAKFERMSGFISLLCLNILLVVFILTFNYEQFIETQKTTVQLGEETHDRVNAVILSIVMAILVIMFYFKGGFNFDKKASGLRIVAKIWIFLNGILIISAFLKNAEYIENMGLTYKKLGVYAFLFLSFIGLIFTFIKIQKKYANAFLVNKMTGYFYGTLLVCSFVNWGSLITSENARRKDFAFEYHLRAVSFNEAVLLNLAKKKNNMKWKKNVEEKITSQKSDKFLSKILFYEFSGQ